MKEKLIILGAGESGVGAALLAKQKQYEVLVSDSGKINKLYKRELELNEIEFEEGKHSEELILNANEIVKTILPLIAFVSSFILPNNLETAKTILQFLYVFNLKENPDFSLSFLVLLSVFGDFCAALELRCNRLSPSLSICTRLYIGIGRLQLSLD